jgi:hypothetical protein
MMEKHFFGQWHCSESRVYVFVSQQLVHAIFIWHQILLVLNLALMVMTFRCRYRRAAFFRWAPIRRGRQSQRRLIWSHRATYFDAVDAANYGGRRSDGIRGGEPTAGRHRVAHNQRH